MCQSPYSIADTTAKLIKPEFTGSGADGLHILIGQRAGAAEVTLANEGVDPLFKVSHGLKPRKTLAAALEALQTVSGTFSKDK
jgi:hypothetical protein